MKYLIALAVLLSIAGCDVRKAEFVVNGTLTGSTCKHYKVVPRYGEPYPAVMDCLAVVESEEGKTQAFPVEAEYDKLLGKPVTVVNVKEGEFRILEITK